MEEISVLLDRASQPLPPMPPLVGQTDRSQAEASLEARISDLREQTRALRWRAAYLDSTLDMAQPRSSEHRERAQGQRPRRMARNEETARTVEAEAGHLNRLSLAASRPPVEASAVPPPAMPGLLRPEHRGLQPTNLRARSRSPLVIRSSPASPAATITPTSLLDSAFAHSSSVRSLSPHLDDTDAIPPLQGSDSPPAAAHIPLPDTTPAPSSPRIQAPHSILVETTETNQTDSGYRVYVPVSTPQPEEVVLTLPSSWEESTLFDMSPSTSTAPRPRTRSPARDSLTSRGMRVEARINSPSPPAPVSSTLDRDRDWELFASFPTLRAVLFDDLQIGDTLIRAADRPEELWTTTDHGPEPSGDISFPATQVAQQPLHPTVERLRRTAPSPTPGEPTDAGRSDSEDRQFSGASRLRMEPYDATELRRTTESIRSLAHHEGERLRAIGDALDPPRTHAPPRQSQTLASLAATGQASLVTHESRTEALRQDRERIRRERMRSERVWTERQPGDTSESRIHEEIQPRVPVYRPRPSPTAAATVATSSSSLDSTMTDSTAPAPSSIAWTTRDTAAAEQNQVDSPLMVRRFLAGDLNRSRVSPGPLIDQSRARLQELATFRRNFLTSRNESSSRAPAQDDGVVDLVQVLSTTGNRTMNPPSSAARRSSGGNEGVYEASGERRETLRPGRRQQNVPETEQSEFASTSPVHSRLLIATRFLWRWNRRSAQRSRPRRTHVASQLYCTHARWTTTLHQHAQTMKKGEKSVHHCSI